MAKPLHQVQQRIKNLKQQINDILHLTSLNNQSIICITAAANNHQSLNNQSSNQSQSSNKDSQEKQVSNNNIQIIHQKHTKFQQKIKTITNLLQKRTQDHLNYLIVKQIQGQQQTVRRDRLNQYQDKIYDQRRLISDKQVFLQSLYRPKKQRPQNMTSEEFQQLRAKQRTQEEKFKLYSLNQEINKLTEFHNKLTEVKNKQNNNNNVKSNDDKNIYKAQQLIIQKMKDEKDLQKTKAHSLETVNLSAFNNLNQKLQKILQQAQLNTTLNQNSQQNSSKKISNQQIPLFKDNKNIQNFQQYQKHFSISQKVFEKQSNNRCFSIKISKLLSESDKSLSKQDVKQKLERMKYLMRRIELKKQENSKKRKQLRDIQRENVHMAAHLKKVKENYLTKLNSLNLNNKNDLEQVKQ